MYKGRDPPTTDLFFTQSICITRNPETGGFFFFLSLLGIVRGFWQGRLVLVRGCVKVDFASRSVPFLVLIGFLLYGSFLLARAVCHDMSLVICNPEGGAQSHSRQSQGATSPVLAIIHGNVSERHVYCKHKSLPTGLRPGLSLLPQTVARLPRIVLFIGATSNRSWARRHCYSDWRFLLRLICNNYGGG